jgi:hypothetical protein
LSSAEALAIVCSVNRPSETVNCSAVIKRQKSDLRQAAGLNCASNGFGGFDINSANFQHCNPEGSKCKGLSGKCLSDTNSGGGLKPPKPPQFDGKGKRVN